MLLISKMRSSSRLSFAPQLETIDGSDAYGFFVRILVQRDRTFCRHKVYYKILRPKAFLLAFDFGSRHSHCVSTFALKNFVLLVVCFRRTCAGNGTYFWRICLFSLLGFALNLPFSASRVIC